jgi:hypothetical protein
MQTIKEFHTLRIKYSLYLQRVFVTAGWGIVMSIVGASQLFAAESGAKSPARQKSAAEIAAELANPNTASGTLNVNLNYITYKGNVPNANQQNALRLAFQPWLPYALGNGVNFFFRPMVPFIVQQDVRVTGGFDERSMELGDIAFETGIGKTFKNGLVLMGSVIGSATDDAFGFDQ